MDGLAAYPQKKEVPEDRNPREQLSSTTSDKGSALYDLIGISSQEMHKDGVKETNLLDPVT